MLDRIKVLFVCSKNQWRSPTAEMVYDDDPRVEVRSRGTARSAKQTVRSGDLDWADLVLVMEDKHRQRLRAEYPGETRSMRIEVLHIP
ncbi:MAG: protein tyrosine phosphatase, partial [Planctomycetota bacterium]